MSEALIRRTDGAWAVVEDTVRGGKMVQCWKPLAPGDLIAACYLYSLQKERCRRSIEIAPGIHAWVTAPGMVFNHSCDPNAAVEIEWGYLDAQAEVERPLRLVWHALKPILPGEEITWDYGTTESECISVPVCLCGAATCRGRAVGKNERGATSDE